MTKKQLLAFDKCCARWIDAYCDDHNCKPLDIPLWWAIETAESHLDNIECGTWGYEEDWDDEEVAQYRATKEFISKFKRYV